MSKPSPIDTLAPRVERLLAQYQALEQAHQQQQATLAALYRERESLRLRLQASRARVDELIARLPANQTEAAQPQAATAAPIPPTPSLST